MRTVDAAEAQARLDRILEDAQRQPILIQQEGKDCAVVLSLAAYERFRSDTVRAFLELRSDIAREATDAGLTEDGIAELLDED
jgi:prevent-host-death family protein